MVVFVLLKSWDAIPRMDFSYSENYFLNFESCSENTPERSQSSENGLFTRVESVLPEIGVVPRLLICVARNFLVFGSVFPFFPRDFRGSAERNNACFFGWLLLLFPKRQGKEDQEVSPFQ